VGTDLVLNSRGVAVADFWNRGVMDIAVAASTGRHALLKNTGDYKRHWLQIELVGTITNRDAVGARVMIEVDGSQQWREMVLGDGYGSQSSLRLHFGLNQHDIVDRIEVHWPVSELTQVFKCVKADRILQITEGETDFVEKHYPVALG